MGSQESVLVPWLRQLGETLVTGYPLIPLIPYRSGRSGTGIRDFHGIPWLSISQLWLKVFVEQRPVNANAFFLL